MNFAHSGQNISSDSDETRHQHAQIEIFLISAQTLHPPGIQFVAWRANVSVTSVI